MNTDEPGLEIEIEALAMKAYAAYGGTTNWKNFQGNPMPRWPELPEQIRDAWKNAVTAVVVESVSIMMRVRGSR